MLITRECDYAVRVRARTGGRQERVSVRDICDKELITAPFAYKILKKLQKAGDGQRDIGVCMGGIP